MKLNSITDKIFTIDNFLSDEECEVYIKLSHEIGYEKAKVEAIGEAKVIESVRNNTRAFYESIETADLLWHKLKDIYPVKKLGNSFAVGLNELFRFYRYESGHQFRPHVDDSFVRNELEASYFTFMIYLNDDCEGGETRFIDHTITPSKGMALLFWHQLEHEGCPVTEGIKYVLRTDVMYRYIGEEN
jgi:predicted 2-oxoglutarate/Fe(II)-dependent dioxygenase YbiX